MHVALQSNGVEKAPALLADRLQDFEILRIQEVIVDENGGLRIGRPGDLQRFRHVRHRPERQRPLTQAGVKTAQRRRLVHHVPEIEAAFEARDDIADPGVRKRLNLSEVMRQPFRIGEVPDQRMALAPDAVRKAPSQDFVGVLVDRVAALRLVVGPVEAERGVVEQRGEPPTIVLFQCGIAQAAEHEQVAAEQEFMSRLLHVHRDAGNRFAVPAANADHAIALAEFPDALPGICEDVAVLRDRLCRRPSGVGCQKRGAGCRGLKECASVHVGTELSGWRPAAPSVISGQTRWTFPTALEMK